MKDLTAKQREIFDYLITCVREESYTPTIREIAEQFGFKSTNAVQDHLKALERKGYISRRANSSRGIEIAREHLAESPGIPIIGHVAAGAPITAIENLDGYLELGNLYEATSHYALRVHGDSMVDAGIWDGDFAIIREQPAINNGEIGVAIVEGEATIKRIRHSGSEVELIPENDLYRPIHVDLATTEFRVGGKVVGIHRVMR